MKMMKYKMYVTLWKIVLQLLAANFIFIKAIYLIETVFLEISWNIKLLLINLIIFLFLS